MSNHPDNYADKEKIFLTGKSIRSVEIESAVQIFLEFLKGFEALDIEGKCVTVFGSARFNDGHPYYELSRQVGGELAKAGFTVLTGGGPGLMEAANRGAKDHDGLSIGCNIKLSTEQKVNPYLDRFVEFEHFFVRKVMLVKYSCAFIAMPGGFGTMDEVFETATLVQTGKMDHFPVILMQKDYWKDIYNFMEETLAKQGAISKKDLDLLHLTDSPREALEIIKQVTTAGARKEA